jgi:hypothetical protein
VKSAILTFITYVIIAIASFGNPLSPILAIFWRERLGAPLWPLLVLVSFIVAAFAFLIPARQRLLRGPTFVAVAMLGSLLSVGAYADRLRSQAVMAFGPDRVIEHSFLTSLREAPREFQFFLHVAAMKNCVPYAWSYREMDFYRLPDKAVQNVLPAKWLIQCGIQRSTVGQSPISIPSPSP